MSRTWSFLVPTVALLLLSACTRGEVERLRSSVEGSEAEIERLEAQIADLTRQLDDSQVAGVAADECAAELAAVARSLANGTRYLTSEGTKGAPYKRVGVRACADVLPSRTVAHLEKEAMEALRAVYEDFLERISQG